MTIKPSYLFLLLFPFLFSCAGGGGSSNNSDSSEPPVEVDYLPRSNYGAHLEVDDKVLHCAGQHHEQQFANYNQAVTDSNHALIYMHYEALKLIHPGKLDSLKQMIETYRNQGKYLLPHIAISMTDDNAGAEDANYEHDVANGIYDDQISILISEIKELNHPVYLRIGYEANGWGWNQYRPDSYRAAFQRITTAINDAGLRGKVATVWHVVSEEDSANNPHSISTYYPGDEHVDWWALSFFSLIQNFSSVNEFVASADAANKPIMIAESTPMGVGTEDGQSDWNAWFKPYFDFIKLNPGIKAFCYINWDWTDMSYSRREWAHWKDGRIEANSTIQNLYQQEITQPIYLHAQTESNYWKLTTGNTDQIAPTAVTNLTSEPLDDGVRLTWDASDNDITRFEVYTNGLFFRSTTEPFITLYNKEFTLSSDIELSVIAVDQSGNKSELSQTLRFSVPDSVEMLVNGNFEAGLSHWQTSHYRQGEAVSSLEQTDPIAGNQSAKVSIVEPSDMFWGLQFEQPISVKKDHRYQINYTVQSDKAFTLNIMLQQIHVPYDSLYQASIDLEPNTPVTINAQAESIEDDSMSLRFAIGNAPEDTQLILDNISMIATKTNP